MTTILSGRQACGIPMHFLRPPRPRFDLPGTLSRLQDCHILGCATVHGRMTRVAGCGSDHDTCSCTNPASNRVSCDKGWVVLSNLAMAFCPGLDALVQDGWELYRFLVEPCSTDLGPLVAKPCSSHIALPPRRACRYCRLQNTCEERRLYHAAWQGGTHMCHAESHRWHAGSHRIEDCWLKSRTRLQTKS